VESHQQADERGGEQHTPAHVDQWAASCSGNSTAAEC
jgi:hypothetical protein